MVYEHHADEVIELREDFRVLARSEGCPVEAIGALSEAGGGTQFHPEDFTPEHPAGLGVLRNFFALATLDRPIPARSPPGGAAAGRGPGVEAVGG